LWEGGRRWNMMLRNRVMVTCCIVRDSPSMLCCKDIDKFLVNVIGNKDGDMKRKRLKCAQFSALAYVYKQAVAWIYKNEQFRAFFLEKEVPDLTRGERTNIRKAL
jgi:hypothetical protein